MLVMYALGFAAFFFSAVAILFGALMFPDRFVARIISKFGAKKKVSETTMEVE